MCSQQGDRGIAFFIADEFAHRIAVGEQRVEHLVGERLERAACRVDGHMVGKPCEQCLRLRILGLQMKAAAKSDDFLQCRIDNGHSESQRVIELPFCGGWGRRRTKR